MHKHSSSLRSFQKSLLALFASALQRPKLWLLGSAALFLLIGAGAVNLRYLLSIDDIVDADFVTTPALNQVKALFDDRNTVFVAFGRKDRSELNATETCAFREWIADQTNGNPEITRVYSTFSARQASWMSSAPGVHRLWFPPVLKLDCDAPPDKNEISLKGGFRALENSPFAGTLIPRSGNDLIAEFYLADNSQDVRFGSFDPSVVKPMMDDFERKVIAHHPDTVARWTGTAVFQYHMRDGYQRAGLLNLLALALLAGLLFLAFGTFRSTVILSTTLIISAILVYGIMGWVGWPVDMLTNSLFIMIIVATLEDFLFLSALQYAGTPHWRTPFRTLLLPSFFTSLTTMVGFGSLMISDLGTIRRFGALCAIAAMVEWGMVFLILPAFLRVFPRWRRWVNPGKASLQKPLARLTGGKGLPRWAARAAMLVLPVAFYGAFHLRVTDTPEGIFPKGHPFRQTTEYLTRTRAAAAQASLVFTDIENETANRAALAQIRRWPEVSSIEDIYEMEDFALKPLPPEIARSTRNEWRSSPMSRRLNAKTGETRAILFLNTSDIVDMNRMRARLTNVCPASQCYLAGTLVSYAEFGERVLKTLLESLAVSLVLVSLILAYLTRATRQRNGVAIVGSAIWGSLTTLAMIFVLRIPIYFISCLCASILVGLAGDNAIQFLFRRRRESLKENVNRLGGAAILLSVGMTLISLAFVFSYFAPVRVLGVLMAAGFLISLFGDFWLLKGLLD